MPAKMEKSPASSFLAGGRDAALGTDKKEQEQHQQQSHDHCFLEDAISLSTSSSNPTPETPLYVTVPTRGEMLPGGTSSSEQQPLMPPPSMNRTTVAMKNSSRDSLEQDKDDSAGLEEDAWAMMDLGSDSSDDDKMMMSSATNLPHAFHMSPEPLHSGKRSHSLPTMPASLSLQQLEDQQEQLRQQAAEHQYHLLCQIQEDRVSSTLDDDDENVDDLDDDNMDANITAALKHESKHRSPPSSPLGSPLRRSGPPPLSGVGMHPHDTEQYKSNYFIPQFTCTKIAYAISKRVFDQEDFAVATWLGFWALLNVTCANYVLTPMRDAVALQVGVKHIPKLTLASSFLAFLSSVPIGWLFEAPDPSRRKVWKKMGLTRGATQGTSLALFYRFFAVCVLAYAVGFQLVDIIQTKGGMEWIFGSNETSAEAENTVENGEVQYAVSNLAYAIWKSVPYWLTQIGSFMYIAFFLVMHLMKLHSISLVWGVTTEAMEYEDVARKQQETRRKSGSTASLSTINDAAPSKTKTRLQRLALVGFGGTVGGVWGSVLASTLAKVLHLPGLLVVSAYLLEVSAELSIELGRIMQKHWEDQQIFQSTNDLTSLDPSMKRSTSLGSMKRISSGNSLYKAHQASMKRVASGNSLNRQVMSPSKSMTEMSSHQATDDTSTPMAKGGAANVAAETPNEDTFTRRLLRGTTTILKSRLLMAIFTYNALFASTSVLLSFQRAELVANRSPTDTSVSADTAFLANINMASSIAIFLFQASGIGAIIAQKCGSRGSLALMPLIRLAGLMSLCWWHRYSGGVAPNLIIFLMLDESTRVVNLAVAKPVRESLWRGLSNEARYEAKPIVDTLANRWGAGSASFCVSVVSRVLVFLGRTRNINDKGEPIVLGLPPVLFLGLIVAAWWVGVSFDLGHVRRRIDMELKKHQ